MAQTLPSAPETCSAASGPAVAITTVGGTTTDRSQTIAGTFADPAESAASGQTIEIDDNGTKIGTAAVASNGSWSDDVLLSDLGTNALSATATDASGRVGTSSPVTFTLDTVLSPPQAGAVAAETAQTIRLGPGATASAAGGRDTFVFTAHPGHTVIDGFSVAGQDADHLSFVHHGLASVADVLRHTTMSGADAVIHLTPHDSVTLVGVSKGELRADPGAFAFHG